MGCVYLATNVVNGKRYVGFTTLDLEERKKQHEKDAKRGSDSLFHKAIRKYGIGSFRWKTVCFSDDRDELCFFEMESIQFLRTLVPNGYNLTIGGDNPPHGPEWSQKMSIAMKGNRSAVGVIRSEEYRQRLSKRMMGHSVSAVAREKISKALTGRKSFISAQTKQKISRALKGRKMSVESRRKMSVAAKNRRKGNVERRAKEAMK